MNSGTASRTKLLIPYIIRWVIMGMFIRLPCSMKKASKPVMPRDMAMGTPSMKRPMSPMVMMYVIAIPRGPARPG